MKLLPYSHLILRVVDLAIFEKIAKFKTHEIKDTQKLKSRNLIPYNINKIMKFKLLLYYCYYCYSNMSQLHVWVFFLLNFVHRLSSTASLLLSELSSAAIGYLDCGLPYALLSVACFVCYCLR